MHRCPAKAMSVLEGRYKQTQQVILFADLRRGLFVVDERVAQSAPFTGNPATIAVTHSQTFKVLFKGRIVYSFEAVPSSTVNRPANMSVLSSGFTNRNARAHERVIRSVTTEVVNASYTPKRGEGGSWATPEFYAFEIGTHAFTFSYPPDEDSDLDPISVYPAVPISVNTAHSFNLEYAADPSTDGFVLVFRDTSFGRYKRGVAVAPDGSAKELREVLGDDPVGLSATTAESTALNKIISV